MAINKSLILKYIIIKNLNYIKNILFFAVIVNIILVIIYMIISKNWYLVTSESMRPYLKPGDVVEIKKQQDYNINDVVLYISDKNWSTKGIRIIHRIILINDDEVITKGDANNTLDPKIKKSDIKGKVVKIYKSNNVEKIKRVKTLLIINITILIISIILVYFISRKYKIIGK